MTGTAAASAGRIGTRPVVRALGLAIAIAALGCAPERDMPRDDVTVLVTIDTMRADVAGCGGDPTTRTPVLDRLARGGVQHAVAVATAPLTLPSHATILSGLLPPEHGARNNGFYRVGEDVPLLADAFASAGWETAAFVAAFPLARRFGLDRGFDVYRDTGGLGGGDGTGYAERSADAVNDELLDWLDARESGRPLFLWAHYFDPHSPYERHPPFPRLRDRAAYAGEVEFVDRELGRLRRALETRFRAARLCVTSDHGESLGEHDEDSHGIFVYEATTRVPLVFAGPGLRAGVLDPVPVGHTEIAASLLAWSDVRGVGFDDVPPPGSGRPERDAIYVESLLPEQRLGWAALRGLRGTRWKVVRAPIPEIYDLRADPGELANLHDDPAARAAAAPLLEAIEDPRWDARPTGPAQVDSETEAVLASLGYVGGDGEPVENTGDRPDPKSRIAINRHLMAAYGLLAAGRLPGARAAVARALSVDSSHKEAYLLLAEIETKSGNAEAAMSWYEHALSLPPAALDPVVHAGAGKVALDAGWNERAERHLEAAVRGNPLDADAWFNWGTAAYRAGRFEDAVTRWEETLRIDPDHPSAIRWLPDARARLDDPR